LLDSRAAVLNDHRDATFVGVCYAAPSPGAPADEAGAAATATVFALTGAGHLCKLGDGKALEGWTALKVPHRT
jgi:hypothetical protein